MKDLWDELFGNGWKWRKCVGEFDGDVMRERIREKQFWEMNLIPRFVGKRQKQKMDGIDAVK